MLAIELSSEDLDELIELQRRSWTDWPARFSCNVRGDIWPTPSFGYSQFENRCILTGTFRILDEAARVLRELRPLAGRFFVCEHGVWTFIEELERKEQIVRFRLSSPLPFHRHCAGHTTHGPATALRKPSLALQS